MVEIEPRRAPATPRLRAERIAWGQDGLITLAQANGVGLTKDAVYRLVRAGSWGRVLPGVLRVGPERGWRQQVRAACLRGGEATAASHRSAGALYELDGVPSGVVEVTSGRSLRSQAKWLTVHETTIPFRVHHVGDIPVTPIARTLVDLASVIPKASLELALEDALRRRLTTIPTLRNAFSPSRGRRGVRQLEGLVLPRASRGRPTDSVFEARVLQALAAAGLPPPAVQYEVAGPRGFRARLDFAFPGPRVALEADSYRWHSGRRAFVHDRERLSMLAGLGWRVVHVTWDELCSGRHGWLTSLRLLIGQQEFDGSSGHLSR